VSHVGNVLRIRAEVAELATVREFVREHANHLCPDAGFGDDVVHAVDELVTNSIVHGYRDSPGLIEVEIESADKSLVVRLRDQAPPFDPTRKSDPDVTLPLERRPRGGMGIYLARSLLDTMTYRHTQDGNELTLSKSCDQVEGGGMC